MRSASTFAFSQSAVFGATALGARNWAPSHNWPLAVHDWRLPVAQITTVRSSLVAGTVDARWWLLHARGMSLSRNVLVSVVLVAVGCSSESTATPPADTGTGSDAGSDTPVVTGPLDLKVETFNIGLAGSFVPNEAARRPKLMEALAKYDADVVCLQEVWTASDKTALKAAVAATYPYAVSFETNLETPIDDPKDATGTVPPALTTAPCAAQAAEMTAAVDCIKSSCNTVAGSEDGLVTSSTCVSTNCAGAIIPLRGAGENRCYGCLLANTPASSFKAMRAECGTNPKGGLGFSGQSSVMIISKHPLSEPAQQVFPSTWLRRNVARATVAVPNGAAVDIYCNHLTPVFLDPLYNYTGQYGGGNTDAKGWEAENLLQANKLITWQKTRGDKKAILLGDMNISRMEGAVPVGYALETLALFEKTYVNGIAAGYTPLCTYCGGPGENPNIPEGDTEKSWLDRIYLANIAATAVKSSARTFTEATVDGATGKVPLSDHYGVRSVITIAP